MTNTRAPSVAPRIARFIVVSSLDQFWRRHISALPARRPCCVARVSRRGKADTGFPHCPRQKAEGRSHAVVDEPREEIRGDAELAPLRVEGGRWLRTSELGALLKERLQTLGNPLAFFEEIGNALSQVTGGDKSASAVNLSSSNIVSVILSVLTPVVSEALIFFVSLVFNL